MKIQPSGHKGEVRLQAGQQHDGLLAVVKPLLELVVVAIFVILFLVQPIRIPSVSMVPTLLAGDLLLVDKQSFAPSGMLDRLLLPPARVRRGDLVVFHAPGERADGSFTSAEQAFLVKRVVGMPGDRLRMRAGRVLLEGQPLAEPYAFYGRSVPNNFRDDFPSLREADPDVEPAWWIELRRIAANGELTLPQDGYFMLGDNRNDSEDSRYWGLVPRGAMVGRPLLVYFSQHSPEDPDSSASLLQRIRDLLHMERKSVRVVR